MKLDATATDDFRTCKELYRLRHELGLVPITQDRGAPEAGSALHAGLKVWFDQGMAEALAARLDGQTAYMQPVYDAVNASWGTDPLFRAKPAKYTGAFLCAVMDGYAAKWPRERDPFTVLKNEEYVAHDFESFEWCGIVDRVIEFADGSVFIMDTKTTSQYFGRDPAEKYELSAQMRGYVQLRLAKGERCDGVYLDLVHLDTRGHKVKTDNYLRSQIRFTDEQLDAWYNDVMTDVMAIRRLKEASPPRWPQHDQSCFKWGRPCQFLAHCKAPLDALPSELYTVERWDPERRT